MATPRTRPYHRGNLAETLVGISVELAVEGGPEALSLREAARRAQVSPTAVYRHFADRSALVEAVQRVVLGRLADALTRALAAPAAVHDDPVRAARERLAAIGAAYVEFAVAHPGEYRMIFAGQCFPKAGASSSGAEGVPADGPYTILSTVLDDMVRAGAMSPEARPGAEIPAWSAVHGLASLILEGPYAELDHHQRTAITDQVVGVLVAGLTSRHC